MIANYFLVRELQIVLNNGILWSKNMVQTNLHINSIALRNVNHMIYMKNVTDNFCREMAINARKPIAAFFCHLLPCCP